LTSPDHKERAMKLYHLLLLVWILFVTMWLFNAIRNKKK
jgi:hypothetical protein